MTQLRLIWNNLSLIILLLLWSLVCSWCLLTYGLLVRKSTWLHVQIIEVVKEKSQNRYIHFRGVFEREEARLDLNITGTVLSLGNKNIFYYSFFKVNLIKLTLKLNQTVSAHHDLLPSDQHRQYLLDILKCCSLSEK